MKLGYRKAYLSNGTQVKITEELYQQFRQWEQEGYQIPLEYSDMLKQEDNDNGYMTEFMKNYGKYQGIATLSRDIVADLVERILIGEDKSIRIEFKFQDELRRYLD